MAYVFRRPWSRQLRKYKAKASNICVLQAQTGSYGLTGLPSTWTLSTKYTVKKPVVSVSRRKGEVFRHGWWRVQRGSSFEFAQFTTTTLTGDVGTYNLTGNTAFGAVYLSANVGVYTLTGNAASLTPVLSANVGNYTLTGSASANLLGMASESGTYVLTGAGSGVVSMVADTGNYTLAGNDADLSVQLAFTGGILLPGGQFTRGKWRQLQKQIADEKEADRKKREAEKERKKAEREAEKLRQKLARQSEREIRSAGWLNSRIERQIDAANAATLGAHHVVDMFRQSMAQQQIALAARRADEMQDEEEALALLLAA